MFSFPFSLFLFSFFLIPFCFLLNLGNQCMSFDIGLHTIVFLITIVTQSDRLHISAKIV